MLHQIRKAMKKEKYRETFEAIVEIDKTYIGGKPCKHNNHKDNKPKRGCNTFKTPVVSVKKRNIRKVHMVVANYNNERKLLSGKQFFNVLKGGSKSDDVVMTDLFSSYNILYGNECNFVRFQINHIVAFLFGIGIHANDIECFWAVLKHGVYGAFHNVSVRHIQKYANEFCYRLNHKDNNEAFASLVKLSM